MPQFVLIFRPTRATDPADLPTRNATARQWVLACRQQGTLRLVCPLEDGGATVSQEGTGDLARERAVASVLVVEAADLQGAVALAMTYPNLAYGAEIEVRPVRPTAPTS